MLLISHNSEFTSALCPETWLVDNGTVVVKHNDGKDESKGKASAANAAA